ncbi:hypothetical protein MMC07_009814 [Pseudocyphellaria aurata]|nr:hypothetical protein [Pseudocyphellaria aurata]
MHNDPEEGWKALKEATERSYGKHVTLTRDLDESKKPIDSVNGDDVAPQSHREPSRQPSTKDYSRPLFDVLLLRCGMVPSEFTYHEWYMLIGSATQADETGAIRKREIVKRRNGGQT